MALIIEINGYKAVGKSTLISGLRKRFPDAIFREGFRKIKMGFNLENENEYYENERFYIQREIEEIRSYQKTNKLVILLRGPEECVFFAEKSPELKFNKKWDVNKHLGTELKKLKELHADGILWLEADEEILQLRKEKDKTKPRNNMEKWNKTWRPHLKNYIMSFPYTEQLNTNYMSAVDVLEWTVDWINEKLDKQRDLKVPDRLYIETTNLCNASCRMCPHSKITRELLTMSDNVFAALLEDLKKMNLGSTTIFMHKEGEPLLDNKIFERINKIASYTNCKKIAINTNAFLLSENKAKEMLKSPVNIVYISLDGFTKKSYEYLRTGLKYDVVFQNVKRFLELKQEVNSKQRVILQMIKYSENSNEVDDYMDFWKQYDCEIFIKEMHSYLDGGMSSITDRLLQEQNTSCTDPFNMLVVYADGSVGCCCWDYNNEINLGNIKDTTLLNIFNGEKLRYIQKLHSKLDCYNISPCNRCMRVFGMDSIKGISNGENINIQ